MQVGGTFQSFEKQELTHDSPIDATTSTVGICSSVCYLVKILSLVFNGVYFLKQNTAYSPVLIRDIFYWFLDQEYK